MKVVITGASGFVGTHLAEHLLDAGDEVLGCSRGGVWRREPAPPPGRAGEPDGAGAGGGGVPAPGPGRGPRRRIGVAGREAGRGAATTSGLSTRMIRGPASLVWVGSASMRPAGAMTGGRSGMFILGKS